MLVAFGQSVIDHLDALWHLAFLLSPLLSTGRGFRHLSLE